MKSLVIDLKKRRSNYRSLLGATVVGHLAGGAVAARARRRTVEEGVLARGHYLPPVLEHAEVRVGLDLELRVLRDLLQLAQVVLVRFVLVIHEVVVQQFVLAIDVVCVRGAEAVVAVVVGVVVGHWWVVPFQKDI